MADPKWDDTAPAKEATPKWEDTTEVAPTKKMGWGEKIGRTATSALPYAGLLGGGLIATPGTAGLGTVPGAALGYGMGKEAEDLINSYAFGDELKRGGLIDEVKRVGKNVLEGATNEMGAQSISAALPIAGNAVEKMAETPLFQNIAERTDLAKKMFGSGAGGLGGRVAAYHIPGLKYVQGLSDTARAAQLGQKGLGWILDKARQIAPLMKDAVSRGGGILGAAGATEGLLRE